MLDAHRQQAFGDQCPRLTVGILIMDGNTLGALDLLEDSGYRQTALLAFLLPLEILQARVDQRQQVVAVFRDIDHHHLLVNIYLSRCQADAGRFVHGFRHVGDKAANGIVNFGDRRRYLLQARIGETQNG